jgi:hypothetical protein
MPAADLTWSPSATTWTMLSLVGGSAGSSVGLPGDGAADAEAELDDELVG